MRLECAFCRDCGERSAGATGEAIGVGCASSNRIGARFLHITDFRGYEDACELTEFLLPYLEDSLGKGFRNYQVTLGICMPGIAVQVGNAKLVYR